MKRLNNTVFYQIYLQSFRDTNSDRISDINEIIEKLGYIKEIGYNELWVNPYFDSLSKMLDMMYGITKRLCHGMA